MTKILIVDDDPANRVSVAEWLSAEGFDTVQARDGEEAVGQLYEGISVIVSDLKMPNLDGIDLMKIVRQRVPHVRVIMLTGSSSVESAVEALQLGAEDYLIKPIHLPELSVRVQRALEKRKLDRQLADLHLRLKQHDEIYKMVGRSDPMRRVFERIRMVADSEATVLITGESGTGKELVARAVHAHSGRADKNFLPVNFAAISESLIESELFGHEAGSFTGATHRREGVFQAAEGGTLFLDEISELDIGLQSKLLRALENRSIMRVGSRKEETIDVRMVAATNTRLHDLIQQGRFREDLYYRLNVVNIHLPPLRDRVDDIPLLTRYFIQSLATENSRDVSEMTPEAIANLQAYSWPGNVRELRNVLESLVVMSLSPTIGVEDLPDYITGASAAQSVLSRPMSLKELEKEAIRRALESHNGKRKDSANLLGISVRTLQRKIKEYNLEPEQSESHWAIS